MENSALNAVCKLDKIMASCFQTFFWFMTAIHIDRCNCEVDYAAYIGQHLLYNNTLTQVEAHNSKKTQPKV